MLSQRRATGKSFSSLKVWSDEPMLTNLQDLEFHGCDGDVSTPRPRLGANMVLTG